MACRGTTMWAAPFTQLLAPPSAGFGIDRGLGGQPAPDYCILACEQWNSPLYCDHNHPQARPGSGKRMVAIPTGAQAPSANRPFRSPSACCAGSAILSSSLLPP